MTLHNPFEVISSVFSPFLQLIITLITLRQVGGENGLQQEPVFECMQTTANTNIHMICWIRRL